jgi:uridine phosphorylase
MFLNRKVITMAKQYHIQMEKGDVGKYVLLPGDPGRVPQIAEFFDSARKVAENREYVTYTGEVDGIPISATSTGIGCPSAAICVEELAKIGAQVFIRVGTAGSLQEQVELGHLVVTTGSIRDEGTTRQYVPLSYPAVSDLGVTSALVGAAEKLGLPHHLGITHCKDAFYAEFTKDHPMSEDWIKRWTVWRRAGVLATSMESAAIFVLASIKGLQAGEVLAVVGLAYKDHPILEGKKGIEAAIQTAVEAVKILEGH